MIVYNGLMKISELMGIIGAIIAEAAVDINQVPLLRTWLVPHFVAWGFQFLDGRSFFAEIATGWLEVYNWIVDNLNLNEILLQLVDYVGDIRDFFNNPGLAIKREIIRRYPNIADLFDDPIAFVLEILFQNTNIPYEFIYNPVAWVREKFDEFLGDLREILYDPAGWVLEKLSQIFPGIYDLINNPEGWIVEKLSHEFPQIYQLISDPAGYIFDTAVNMIEDTIELNFERFAKIGERILNRIF